jgi:phosphoribosylformylglycinamidine synthase
MPPWLDLDQEQTLQQCVLTLIQKGWVQSAHDCSEGGLLVTLAECCLTHPSNPFGAQVALTQERLRLDALFFGESPSRVLVSVKQEHLGQVRQCIQDMGAKVPMILIGQVTDNEHMDVTVQGPKNQTVCHMSLPVTDLADRWHHSLAQQVGIEKSS